MLKLWYIHTMEYHLAIKRNELLMHTTWMDLKGIMMSEKKIQFQKITYVWLHLYNIFEKTKL